MRAESKFWGEISHSHGPKQTRWRRSLRGDAFEPTRHRRHVGAACQASQQSRQEAGGKVVAGSRQAHSKGRRSKVVAARLIAARTPSKPTVQAARSSPAAGRRSQARSSPPAKQASSPGGKVVAGNRQAHSKGCRGKVIKPAVQQGRRRQPAGSQQGLSRGRRMCLDFSEMSRAFSRIKFPFQMSRKCNF